MIFIFDNNKITWQPQPIETDACWCLDQVQLETPFGDKVFDEYLEFTVIQVFEPRNFELSA